MITVIKMKIKMFINIGGNIPGGNFLGENFPGELLQGRIWWLGIFRVLIFQWEIFLIPYLLLESKQKKLKWKYFILDTGCSSICSFVFFPFLLLLMKKSTVMRILSIYFGHHSSAFLNIFLNILSKYNVLILNKYNLE